MFGKIVFWIVSILMIIGVAAGVVHLFRRNDRFYKGMTIVLFATLLILVVYHVYDNNRIVVKQDVVFIENLPPQFQDFTILQITDLHGKYFGQNQAYLTALINTLEYDIIAVTGDMETSSNSFDPFIALLEGIKNKENLFYVNGNSDLAYDFLTGTKTDSGQKIEECGCILLDKPYPLMREGQILWLVDDLSTSYRDLNPYQDVPRTRFRSDIEYIAYQEHYGDLGTMADRIKESSDLTVALAHIPRTQTELEKMVSPVNFWGSDLILAGHYHGGQIRIPFYGALFIPARSPFLENFFPDQRYVSGLIAGNNVQQYVSRGLGSSNIPFRLFNTPEINLLTLKTK